MFLVPLPTGCVDGSGTDSYVIRSTLIDLNAKWADALKAHYNITKDSITVEELAHYAGYPRNAASLPEIKDNTIASDYSSSCNKPLLYPGEYHIYKIKASGVEKRTNKAIFNKFVNEYNSSCNGCLIMFSDGCC